VDVQRLPARLWLLERGGGDDAAVQVDGAEGVAVPDGSDRELIQGGAVDDRVTEERVCRRRLTLSVLGHGSRPGDGAQHQWRRRVVRARCGRRRAGGEQGSAEHDGKARQRHDHPSPAK
jgi:hypothetical protein